MSEGGSKGSSEGAFRRQALCNGNSPGFHFMGRSSNWAAGEDFEYTYNGLLPLLCLSSQLKMGRSVGLGLTNMGKAEDAGWL
jgi:hypothetical protein